MRTLCEHPRLILSSKAVELVYTGCRPVFNGRTIDILDFDNTKTFSKFDINKLYFQRHFGPGPQRATYNDKEKWLIDYHNFIENVVDRSFVVDRNGVCEPLYMIVPCGHCALCHELKVRNWQTKVSLESQSYEYPPLFVTLTYDEQSNDGSLHAEHFNLFINRLRMMLRRHGYQFQHEESSLRYIVAGEYGERTMRPHYHVLLWNYPIFGDKVSTLLKMSEYITREWRYGDLGRQHVYEDGSRGKDLDIEYAKKDGRYVVDYALKSLPDEVLNGREAPFVHQSSRPAIGFGSFFWNNIFPRFYDNVKDSFVSFIDKFSNRSIKVKLTRSFRSKVYPSYSQATPAMRYHPDVDNGYTTFRPELRRYLNGAMELYHQLSLLWTHRLLVHPVLFPTLERLVSIVAHYPQMVDGLSKRFWFLRPRVQSVGFTPLPVDRNALSPCLDEAISFVDAFKSFFFDCFNISHRELDELQDRVLWSEKRQLECSSLPRLDFDVYASLLSLSDDNNNKSALRIL